MPVTFLPVKAHTHPANEAVDPLQDNSASHNSRAQSSHKVTLQESKREKLLLIYQSVESCLWFCVDSEQFVY